MEKYPSSRMANRYTRIFDAGGLAFLEGEPQLSSPAAVKFDLIVEAWT